MTNRYSVSDKKSTRPPAAIAKRRRGTLDPMSGPDSRNKSLGIAQNERVRAFVRAVVDDEFKGVVSHAAKAIGISQSMLHDFLKGSRGAGQGLLTAVATYKRISLDALLGGGQPQESVFMYAPIPPALAAVLKEREGSKKDYLPETKAQLRTYTSFHVGEVMTQADWVELAEGYERENRHIQIRLVANKVKQH